MPSLLFNPFMYFSLNLAALTASCSATNRQPSAISDSTVTGTGSNVGSPSCLTSRLPTSAKFPLPASSEEPANAAKEQLLGQASSCCKGQLAGQNTISVSNASVTGSYVGRPCCLTTHLCS
eukprot:GHRR01015338.1.p1 GENE.GHRR01015338.1~~GHRR01015338.1.p1  ORF type:complete len:121 (-),score=5.98 GHRR01015338.1:1954-2316(-)